MDPANHRFQTQTEIRTLLASAGLVPRKRYGQHFLIDGNLMRRLLASADVQNEDAVLEVGPGTGSLTGPLAALAGRLIVVEVDRALCEIVRRELGERPNVTLIHADCLSSKHRIAPEVSQALAEARRAVAGQLMLVANLPYNIAAPLLIDLLLEPYGMERFCFTVQREVAERFAASPGTKEFGPISVAVQCVCRIQRLAELPPQVFWPRPAVASTMLRLDVERNPFETLERLRRFLDLVRSTFLHRRKTMRYNLSHAVGPQACEALTTEFDLSKRPEAFNVDEWIAIGRRVEKLSGR